MVSRTRVAGLLVAVTALAGCSAPAPQDAAGGWSFTDDRGVQAVSYTHLTLPTNREV